LELIIASNSIHRGICHTYGVDLDVNKYEDINLIPISNPIGEAQIVIEKSDIKVDLPDDVQILLEPSKQEISPERKR
jgi:hypothetical protein